MSSSSLTVIKTFRLSPQTKLCILRGSVVDFAWQPPSKAAIVNAANEGCLGGGGVDGAISHAGGPKLHRDRMALPVLGGGVRCPTGNAKRTGPGTYGDLQVSHVIHAVGPRYFDCVSDEEGDRLLQSAYVASLDRAKEAKLQAVAFSLLSAGVYRGDRTVKEVLSIAIASICDWVERQGDDSTLEGVFMCGFNPHEVNMLVDIAEDDMQLEIAAESKQGKDSNESKVGNDMDVTLDEGEPETKDKGEDNNETTKESGIGEEDEERDINVTLKGDDTCANKDNHDNGRAEG